MNKIDIATIMSVSMLVRRKNAIEWDLDELLHGAPIPVGIPIEDNQLLWNAWGALSDPAILSNICRWAKAKIQNWSFDCVCAMSSSGTPIATLLSCDLNKTLLAADNKTLLVLPADVSPSNEHYKGKRILLVDSIVQSGYHLNMIVNKIQHKEGEAIGVVTLCLNDMQAGERLDNGLIDNWVASNRIVCLYTMKEFYELWRK